PTQRRLRISPTQWIDQLLQCTAQRWIDCCRILASCSLPTDTVFADNSLALDLTRSTNDRTSRNPGSPGNKGRPPIPERLSFCHGPDPAAALVERSFQGLILPTDYLELCHSPSIAFSINLYQ